MKTRKQLFQKAFSVLLACLTVVSVCLVTVYAEPEAEPETEIGAGYQYPKAEVMQLDIIMQPYKYLKMIYTPIKEKERTDEIDKKYDALVSINGSAFREVGIRLRGDSSLTMGSKTSVKRFPLEIRFDHVDPNGSYNGNPSLKLINCQSPATLFAELVAMEAFRFMGIPTPEMTPVFIRINDQDFGAYLAVEDINVSFIQKYFDGTGSLYRTKSIYLETDPGKVQSDLIDSLFIKVDHGNRTLDLMEKTAAQGKSIESFLNLDEFLRFLACDLFNFDTDSFRTLCNFFLYDDHGRFVILPWDKDAVFSFFSPQAQMHSLYQYFANDKGPDTNNILSQIRQSPENEEKIFAYVRTLNDKFLNPSAFLPWLRQYMQDVCPYLQRDVTFSAKSNHIYYDLTKGQYLHNGTEGNLLLTFETMHEQLALQLQDETAAYSIPPDCKVVLKGTTPQEESKRIVKYGHRIIRRICSNYWALRHQFFWQEYGSVTVCIGCIFAAFFCLAVVSTHVSKGSFRRRKKREDVWNE